MTSVYLYIYYSLPCITVEAPKNLPYDWVSTIAAVHNRSANNIFMHSSALLKPETMEMLIFPSLYLFIYFEAVGSGRLHCYIAWIFSLAGVEKSISPKPIGDFFFFFL